MAQRVFVTPDDDAAGVRRSQAEVQLFAARNRLLETCHEAALIAGREHAALLATLKALNRVLNHDEPVRARVFGGMVDAASVRPADVTGSPSRGTAPGLVAFDAVEVRCRFTENHWAGGFVVCDVVNNAGKVRYRLCRRSDGYVLPVLFEETDVSAVLARHE